MTNNRKITICACSSRSFIPTVEVARLAAVLRNNGYEVSIHPDLCEAAEHKSDDLCAAGCVVGCYSRAMSALYAAAEKPQPTFIELREHTADYVLEQLQITEREATTEEQDLALQEITALPKKIGTDAWYPVLETDKCVNCGKCHDFCLFGVYDKVDGKVKVIAPANCKNNCPACARICPVGAIIFPKYDKAPINGGEQMEEGTIKIDMEAVYADALRTRLAHRRASVMLLKNQKK